MACYLTEISIDKTITTTTTTTTNTTTTNTNNNNNKNNNLLLLQPCSESLTVLFSRHTAGLCVNWNLLLQS
jgi:hypothetical protein